MQHIRDLWDFSNPAASEERFRDAADTSETDEEEGFALTQLARAQGLQGKFDEARETLRYAKERIGDEGSATGVQYLLELGRVENSSGNPSAAMPHFQQAMEIAEKLGLGWAEGDAAHMLAIAAPQEQQQQYGVSALARVEASEDPDMRRWIGAIVNNLGWALIDLGRTEEALPYFRRSLEFRIEQGAAMPIRIARYSVGSVLRRLGRYEEAMAVLETALETPGFEGYLHEEIGECLYGMGREEAAKPYFASAQELLRAETDLEQTEPERIEKLKARA